MNLRHTLKELVTDVREGSDYECLKGYSIDELSELIINGAFENSTQARERLKMYLIYRLKDEGYKINYDKWSRSV